ncbi:hypothetical protein ACIP5Y_37055 [Nocardia sp. NPDC088792]|uniref:hypothetical protein n=1 Tax=Nocardia sp. NPDC088792 TaxID=3364332 RepID=UPI003811E2E9
MKAAVLASLTVPFLLFAPAVAHADPQIPVPGQNTSPDDTCNTTQNIVDTIKTQHPDYTTPEQIASGFDAMMGAKVPGYQLFQGQQHQQLLDTIQACGIATS